MTLLDAILTSPNLIPILALVVSFVSIGIGFLGLLIQRQHNILSVKPLGNIAMGNYDIELGIAINNNGTGPLIIKSIRTIDNQGIQKKYPIDWIPAELQKNITFQKLVEGAALINGKDPIMLLLFRLNPLQPAEVQQRDKIRSILKNLTIHITYSDIYGNLQPELVKKLDWFDKTEDN